MRDCIKNIMRSNNIMFGVLNVGDCLSIRMYIVVREIIKIIFFV